MSSRELIAPRDAVDRLVITWRIPHSIAEQIVEGVLLGGQCFVRGRRLGERVLRDISKEIAAAMASSYYKPSFPFLILPHDFTDVAIDWHDLLKHGRSLVPPEWEQAVAAAEAGQKIKRSPSMKKVLDYIKENYPDGVPE